MVTASWQFQLIPTSRSGFKTSDQVQENTRKAQAD
jgi:hypothetical protein